MYTVRHNKKNLDWILEGVEKFPITPYIAKKWAEDLISTAIYKEIEILQQETKSALYCKDNSSEYILDEYLEKVHDIKKSLRREKSAVYNFLLDSMPASDIPDVPVLDPGFAKAKDYEDAHILIDETQFAWPAELRQRVYTCKNKTSFCRISHILSKGVFQTPAEFEDYVENVLRPFTQHEETYDGEKTARGVKLLTSLPDGAIGSRWRTDTGEWMLYDDDFKYTWYMDRFKRWANERWPRERSEK